VSWDTVSPGYRPLSWGYPGILRMPPVSHDANLRFQTSGGDTMGDTVDSPRHRAPDRRTDLYAHLDMNEIESRTTAPLVQPEILGDATCGLTWSATPYDDRYAMATTCLGLLVKWQIKALRGRSR
jgi:hypothetical protein